MTAYALSRIRWYAFAAAIVALAVFVGLAVVGAQKGIKDSLDLSLILASGAMIVGGTVFAVISWRLAARRLAASGGPQPRSRRTSPQSKVLIFGAAFLLVANVGIVVLSGGASLLQLPLVVLVVVLLVLVQRAAKGR